jgi:hypothetical protein
MLLALMGLAALVIALSFHATPRAPPLLAGMGICAMVGGVAGAAAGSFLGSSENAALLVRPAHAPRLPHAPPRVEALDATLDAAARLQGPGFSAGLSAEAQVTPSGDAVMVHLSAGGEDALRAWAAHAGTVIVEPAQRHMKSLRGMLESVRVNDTAEEQTALRLAMGSTEEPEMVMGPVQHDDRSKGQTAVCGTLAGALLGFALFARKRD